MEWALLLFGIFAFGILPELFDTDDQNDDVIDVGDTGGGDDLLGGGDTGGDTGGGTGGGDSGEGSTGGEVAQTDDENSGEETDGASDDTLSPIFDTADTSQGDDTSSEGEQPMEVADFEIGEDILLVTMSEGADQVYLDVEPSDDGADGNVFVDNKLVAVLMGVPDATPEDVFLAASKMAA